MPNFPRASLMLASVLFLVHSVLAGKSPFRTYSGYHPLGELAFCTNIIQPWASTLEREKSYIAADGQKVPVAAIDGGDKYEALVRDSLDTQGRIIWRHGKTHIRVNDELVEVPKDPKENPEVAAIFEDGLKRLKGRIEQEPGAAGLRITSVALPYHLNDTLYSYAHDAIFRSEPHLRVPWQVKRSRHVDRMAYGLDNCEAYGVDPADCDDEDAWHHLLMIDLNDDYLGLCLADLDGELFSSHAKDIVRDLGAKNVQDPNDENRTWERRLHEALQAFFGAHIDGEENSYIRESLHAIVLSGDAGPRAFSSVKKSIASILPGVPIKDSIDPLYVGAVGAAEMAKKQVEDPSLLEDNIKGYVPADPPSHDEL